MRLNFVLNILMNIMESSKDLYHILELDRNCTTEDIRRSYKRLALKYHPDKCDQPQEKFIDIQNAYHILSNPSERNRYDTLNSFQKVEYYDILKTYIKTRIPNIDEYIRLFFDGDENNFKSHIENVDLVGICNKIFKKIPTIDFSEIYPPIENIDIYGTQITTFEERYLDKYRKIIINRQTKCPDVFYVPLRESRVVLKGEGEHDRYNNIHGDVIIDIELDEHDDFIQVNNDIYYTRYISLYEYLYGGEFELYYFDEILDIKFSSFIEKYPFLTIEGKGMPIAGSICFNRGDLIILLKIKDIDSLHDNIKKICN